ncbi:MAG: hypothetical protein HKN70_10970 [Gammaproteobacteria bacterium]|nr:hypothetical protein [Gammaproteobacteria bacterium]
MASHSNSPLYTDEESARYLRELASLNYRFIKLLGAGEQTCISPGLSDTLRTTLASLPDESHRRLSSCPYSLFDLKFADVVFWTDLLCDALPLHTKAPSRVREFALAALIYAQHLCYRSADLGVLLLGLAPPVTVLLRQASVGQLMDRTDHMAEILTARLITDPHFWPDLVNYVQDGTQQQYLAAQTSALQLMAAQGAGWSR